MNNSAAVARVKVSADGHGVVSHAGVGHDTMAVRGHFHPGNRGAIAPAKCLPIGVVESSDRAVCLAAQALSRINTHHQRHMH